MSGSRQQSFVVARQLVRTFGSAPDPRRRAQTVLSELKRADDWSAEAQRGILAAEVWLQGTPAIPLIEPRLRELLGRLAAEGA